MNISENELVSIIVPVYNAAKFIEMTIDSALASSYPFLEILIINDGSTDNSQDIIDRIVTENPTVKSFIQENKGVSATRNYAISKATGKYILPLDADDLISVDYITHAVNELRNDENVKIVYGKAEYFGDRSGDWNLPEFDIHLLARRNIIYVSGVFRKSDFERTPGYCPEMPSLEDWDLWISLLENGGTAICLNEKCFYYRIHEKSNRLANRGLKKQMIDILNSRHFAFFYKELGGKLHYQRTWSTFFNFFSAIFRGKNFYYSKF